MKSEYGFTLVELIIGMALISLILSGVYGVLDSSIKAKQSVYKQGVNIQDSRSVINAIVEEVRSATNITNPPLSQSGKVLTYNIDSEIRKIYIGTNSDSNTIIIEKNGVVSQRLAMQNAQNLTFTRTGTINAPNKVQIDLTLAGSSSGNPTISMTVSTLNSISSN